MEIVLLGWEGGFEVVVEFEEEMATESLLGDDYPVFNMTRMVVFVSAVLVGSFLTIGLALMPRLTHDNSKNVMWTCLAVGACLGSCAVVWMSVDCKWPWTASRRSGEEVPFLV